jgi:hypothetical protein
VVGALVFSVSAQALAACLHEYVITLFCCHQYRNGIGGLTTMPVQCGAAGAEFGGDSGEEDECVRDVVERRSEPLGIKGYLLPARSSRFTPMRLRKGRSWEALGTCGLRTAMNVPGAG